MKTKYLSRILGHGAARVAHVGYTLSRRISGIDQAVTDQANSLAKCLVGPEPCVIDIGANIGQFASSVFELAPSARVLSIDPIPSNVEACKQRFGGKANYGVIQAAIGLQSGPNVTFKVHPYSQASSMLAPSSAARQSFRSLDGEMTEISTPMFSLDDLMRSQSGFETVNLLKIDVEGFEAQVLEGANDTLSRSQALLVETQVIAMNDGAELFDQICHLARKAGFRFDSIQGELRDVFGNLLMMDLLFVRRSHAASRQ
jgi:FkbM family methyltransferase